MELFPSIKGVVKRKTWGGIFEIVGNRAGNERKQKAQTFYFRGLQTTL